VEVFGAGAEEVCLLSKGPVYTVFFISCILNLICPSGLWQVMNDLEELPFPITSGNRSDSGCVRHVRFSSSRLESLRLLTLLRSPI